MFLHAFGENAPNWNKQKGRNEIVKVDLSDVFDADDVTREEDGRRLPKRFTQRCDEACQRQSNERTIGENGRCGLLEIEFCCSDRHLRFGDSKVNNGRCDGQQDDNCPTEAGPLSNNGCPVPADTDGDGIIDAEDACPDKAGTAENKGCPEIEEEDKTVLDLAMREVQFQTSRAVLLEESRQVLDQIGAIMDRYPEYSLKISGHTDSIGDDESNQYGATTDGLLSIAEEEDGTTISADWLAQQHAEFRRRQDVLAPTFHWRVFLALFAFSIENIFFPAIFVGHRPV